MLVHLLADSIRTAVLVSGMVTMMMMLIEVFNLKSNGKMFKRLASHRVGQVLLSALLGSVPGCMGGFASVSLYNHGMISFGALVAMLIASSGDEAFMMLAMFPARAGILFAILFVLAVACGLLVDLFPGRNDTCHSMTVHEADVTPDPVHRRSWSWRRIVLLLGVVLFVAALLLGLLEHDGEAGSATFDILSEDWMYWLFSILSLALVAVLLFAGDHFIEEHLWEHIVCHHLPSILAWTFGTVMVVGLLMHVFNLEDWTLGNTWLMILLAALIGLIPESGPHLVFVTMYAAGLVPMPVLLASCISQDGHASLPLLAQSRRNWFKAKVLNVIVALVVGYVGMLIM